jgi:predicted RNA binding protein YcfA (HicA-like mRNA interferase family)
MSEVDFSRLRSVTARRLIAAVEKDGFTLARQSGSHRHYKHLDGRRVTISFLHSSDTFRP